MDDKQLLAGLCRGEEAALEQLFQRYSRYVAAVAAKVGGGRLTCQDIEEICADVFVKLWQNCHGLQLQRDSLKAYLAAAARNRTLNALRDKKEIWLDGLEEETVTSPSTEARCLQAEEAAAINQVIGELEEPDRECFIRRYFYQEKICDIAKAKNMNVKTVSARLIKARQRLQAVIEERGIL